ncbi:MAG: sodium:proton antiporter NhaD, partial [Halioglobus sp.]|nr:sodium:proton antiporter NhaD [Halioglobus sp.]
RDPEAHFDIFHIIEKVEFDTLLFFFGVLVSVGALQYMGFLALLSTELYGNLGFTTSNILIGVLSAIVDNIPIMFAVLKMDPAMGVEQWLLITLTAGVGGSLLSIGSAAGVAVMGMDRENYTFLKHLKWTPAILAGYFASIGCWWLFTA